MTGPGAVPDGIAAFSLVMRVSVEEDMSWVKEVLRPGRPTLLLGQAYVRVRAPTLAGGVTRNLGRGRPVRSPTPAIVPRVCKVTADAVT